MEARKLLAIFLPLIAIMVFTIVNSFLGKAKPTKRQKQASLAVALTGITVMIVVAVIVL